DISEIKGNIPDSEKQVGINGFTGVMALGPIFLSEIGGRIRIVEMNVWNADAATSARAEIVFEIHVTTAEKCVIMHGACSVFIVANCTGATVLLLGLVIKFDGTGLSQSMNLNWHHAVFPCVLVVL
ncbi:hypothetical protein C8J57DRAFT_1088500, partial [Mycena rebaudengoi]